jgi:hypothetical protein
VHLTPNERTGAHVLASACKQAHLSPEKTFLWDVTEDLKCPRDKVVDPLHLFELRTPTPGDDNSLDDFSDWVPADNDVFGLDWKKAIENDHRTCVIHILKDTIREPRKTKKKNDSTVDMDDWEDSMDHGDNSSVTEKSNTSKVHDRAGLLFKDKCYVCPNHKHKGSFGRRVLACVKINGLWVKMLVCLKNGITSTSCCKESVFYVGKRDGDDKRENWVSFLVKNFDGLDLSPTFLNKIDSPKGNDDLFNVDWDLDSRVVDKTIEEKVFGLGIHRKIMAPDGGITLYIWNSKKLYDCGYICSNLYHSNKTKYDCAFFSHKMGVWCKARIYAYYDKTSKKKAPKCCGTDWYKCEVNNLSRLRCALLTSFQ